MTIGNIYFNIFNLSALFTRTENLSENKIRVRLCFTTLATIEVISSKNLKSLLMPNVTHSICSKAVLVIWIINIWTIAKWNKAQLPFFVNLHKSLRIFRVAEVACLHERRSCESLFYIPLNERGKVTINSLKLDLWGLEFLN